MVIAGAGNAGVRAALSMRAAGWDGPITMISAEEAETPIERPPLSKWSDGEVPAKPIVPPELLSEAQITQVTGTIKTLDPGARTLVLSDGAGLAYDRLLLATGAVARRLDPSISGGTRIHYLRDMQDATGIRRAAEDAGTALIIGGGFIGLELAASLRGMGLSVAVRETADRLLSRAVSETVASIVQDLHEAEGVHFQFGPGLDTSLQSDLVIAGIGSLPNTELAETAGLTTNNGISVDTYLQTSDANIFAAGDCCNFPLYGASGPRVRLESWQAAGDQGALAGRNMASADRQSYGQVPWFWSEHYGHTLQVAGLPAPDLTLVERSYGGDHRLSFGVNADNSLAYACGIAPGTKIAKDIRFAAKLIAAGKQVEPGQLSDPARALKSMVKA